MTRLALALVLLAISVATARGDAESDADRAFHAALELADRGDGQALDQLEALGAARPITRWTDDAWIEAARLAERGGDYARARRAYEQTIAIGTDERLVARARASLARLTSITGAGQWDAVAREHERLVSAVFGGDDPRDELVQLEALVAQHPGYPRTNAIRIALGRGWEEEGERARALTWLREASDVEPAARVALIRALIRADELDEAEGEIARADTMVKTGATIDRTALTHARRALDTAKRRAWIRRVLWGVLALLVALAAIAMRRSAGSWHAAGRRFVRPPIEVIYLIPIAAVLVIIAQTGNPLVGCAVTWIVIAGVGITWLSGAVLDAARSRGALGLRRIGVHVVAVMLAVGATSYLAVERSGSLELILETLRGGHALR